MSHHLESQTGSVKKALYGQEDRRKINRLQKKHGIVTSSPSKPGDRRRSGGGRKGSSGSSGSKRRSNSKFEFHIDLDKHRREQEAAESPRKRKIKGQKIEYRRW